MTRYLYNAELLVKNEKIDIKLYITNIWLDKKCLPVKSLCYSLSSGTRFIQRLRQCLKCYSCCYLSKYKIIHSC